MSFLVKSSGIQNKVVDTSFLAVDYTFLPFLPLSLGVRTQSLKLRFADPRTKATFLDPLISFQEAVSRFGIAINEIESAVSSGHFFDHNHASDIALKFGKAEDGTISKFISPVEEAHKTSSPDRSPLRAFLGDTVSIIYFPIYVKGTAVYDAILDRPIGKLDARDTDHLSLPVKQRDWAVHFISAQCPDCGWDLTGGRQSLSLVCKNCDTAWQASQCRFKKLSCSVVPWKEKKTVFLPFWRMEVQISGLDLHSYADLVRFANLPRAIKKEWEKTEIFFWAPAFKLQPGMFLKLATQMTIFQPSGVLEESLPASTLHPVTLGSKEVFDTILITLAHIAVKKEKIFPLLHDAGMKLQNAALVYFPFTVKGNEFVQAQTRFSIQRNALRE